MAGTLEHPKTQPDARDANAPEPEAPEGSPDDVAPELGAAVRACASCGSALVEGQDWCLECGTAQPGRVGGRPGWRAALTVLAVTGLLAGGATAASYAALSSDAQREASAPPPPAAAPQIAQPPVQTVPPPVSADDTPLVDAPDSDPADVPDVKAPADDADLDPVPSSPAPVPSAGGDSGSSGASSGTSGGSGTGTGSGAGTATPADPSPITIGRSGARLYDPYGRLAEIAAAGGTTAATPKPGNAVDGRPGTAFELPVDDQGIVRAGLALSLSQTRVLDRLDFDVDTPGFTVEVYGTRSSALPPDVLDARWEHVGARRDVGTSESVELDGRFRHVLLWITEQPADTKVAIPEAQLFDK